MSGEIEIDNVVKPNDARQEDNAVKPNDARQEDNVVKPNDARQEDDADKVEKEDIEELVYKFISGKRLNIKQRTEIYEELCKEIIKNNIPETQYKIMTTKNSIDIIINLEYVSIETLLTILVIADYLPQ